MVSHRIAAEPAADLVGPPHGPVVGGLTLRSIGQPMGAPRSEAAPAGRQVQFADAPVSIRADEPPPQPAEPWPRRDETDPVVDLVPLVGPVVADAVPKPEPAVPGVGGGRLECDNKLVVIERKFYVAVSLRARPDDP